MASSLLQPSLLLWLLLMIIIITSTEMSESLELDEDFPNERNALVQLRDILNSTGNLHSNWTGPPCQGNVSRWAGISCTNNGRVSHLVLEGINFAGSIIPPTLLKNMTFLSKLSLRNNSIHGPLPHLSGLNNLEFLFLSRNQFSGSIPNSYIDLPKLTKLELQENHLQGSIPPFDQPTLVAFNVSFNRLNGSIPETTALERFPASSYDSNSNLCGRPLDVECPKVPPKKLRKEMLKLWSIALIAAAAALVPFLLLIFLLCSYRRIHKKEITSEKPGVAFTYRAGKKISTWSESTEDAESNVELEFFDRSRGVFDLDDLLRASAEVIGSGRLGTTYKAVVECGGPTVAVKRLIKDMNDLSKKEFLQQLQLLGKLKHENLVEIISYYYAKEEKLLICEYIPHGNLFELLHVNRGMGRQAVNWSTRLSIIKGIAKGLNFLHHSLPSHKVPHGNLKSTNVLILLHHRDQVQQVYHSCKLSDYGFLPLLPSRKSSSSLHKNLASSRSPEFYEGKKLTVKTDIYCFGIVLLEVITGKTPVPVQNIYSDTDTDTDTDNDNNNNLSEIEQ